MIAPVLAAAFAFFTPGAIDAPGPSKAILPLAILLLVLIAGCGRVLLRGDRVDD